MTYTAGEMKKLYYVPEVSYGVTPTSALTWGANCIDLKGKFNKHPTFYPIEVGRSNFQVTRDAYDAGFTVKALAQMASGAYDWRQFWAVYGMGALTGLTDHLVSFSAQTGLTVGASHVYNLYYGCKIDKLTISCEKPRAAVVFDADVMCRWKQASTTKAFTGLQSLTVGADPANITTPIMLWDGIMQRNIAGAGLVTWHPTKWTLTVDNKLKREYGNRLGADSVRYSVAEALPEDVREILLEVTLPHADQTYNDAKMNDSVFTAVTIPLDTYTLTLSNGEVLLEDDDWPTLKHGLMAETVRIRFPTLSIASS